MASERIAAFKKVRHDDRSVADPNFHCEF